MPRMVKPLHGQIETDMDMFREIEPFDVPEDCVMVDTIGLSVVGVDPARLPKKYKLVDGDDTKKWAKGTLTGRSGAKSLVVTGVKSRREFRLEGSVAMHAQGHNIVSPGDMTMLSWVAMRDAQQQLNLGISAGRAKAFVRGQGLRVTRVDTPVLLNKPRGITTAAAINGLALAGLLSGINTSVYVGESVYFDQQSQLQSLKLYDKLAEVGATRGFAQLDSANPLWLLDVAATTLRLEAVFRQKYLIRRFGGRLPQPWELSPDVLAGMLSALLSDYDLRREIRKPLREEELMAIIPRYRTVVLYWMHGYDIKKALDFADSTFGRARAYIRHYHSIDIDTPPPGEVPDRIELGDILSPANMLPVPAHIRADRDLFMHCDMAAERQRIDALQCELDTGDWAFLDGRRATPSTAAHHHGEHA